MVNKNKKNSCQSIYFSICNLCFWCASCVDIEKMATANAKCPYCDNPILELTPIICWTLTNTLSDVIKIATRNGANALGILNKTGTIENGKEADMIIRKNSFLD